LRSKSTYKEKRSLTTAIRVLRPERGGRGGEGKKKGRKIPDRLKFGSLFMRKRGGGKKGEAFFNLTRRRRERGEMGKPSTSNYYG